MASYMVSLSFLFRFAKTITSDIWSEIGLHYESQISNRVWTIIHFGLKQSKGFKEQAVIAPTQKILI